MPRLYSLREWHRVRRVRIANEPLCRMCKALGILRPAQHVDHIVPISKGGEWFDPENLQSLCISCHALKTRADEGKTVSLGCRADGLPIGAAHHWNESQSQRE